MQVSIVNFLDCAKYDFGEFLWSPDFFQKDKLDSWQKLEEQSSNNCKHYYEHIKSTVKIISKSVICHDLTDGLPKFFDNCVEVNCIESTKKNAAKGDFVISRLRSYLEEMGIVEDREKKQLFSTEFLVFRSKNNNLSTSTLFALCMSKYVQIIFKRGQYGTEHPRFYDFLLTKLPIPDCLLSLDSNINHLIQRTLSLRQQSRYIYTEAENLLLSELGLTCWQPKHRLTFIKNYSDTQQAERIDAEYYQLKYEEIIKAIQNYSGGWDTLGNLVKLKDKNFSPKDKQLYKYIELANIAGNGEVSDCMVEEGQDLPTRARRKVATNDVIVSSIEGSLSSIALIENEYDKALCSTGFHVVNSKAFNPETLLVLLKSIIAQLQLKKGCSGTILTAINKGELGKIVLPKVDDSKQLEIQKKVAGSFHLRKQSKHLLECAKRAVEIAIEQDEQTAIKWLENETNEIQI